MKRNFLLLAAVLVCSCGTVFGWGKVGHDAVAYIAECNLTPKAKKNIEKYLDGRSIVYYASWMDEVRDTKPYGHTTRWHTDAVDAEGQYAPNAKDGDAVAGIEDAVEKLRDYRHQDDSTVRVAIYCLVHLVGDMHCPSHVKYPWYKNFKFNLAGRDCAFHSFWDSEALELNHRWYYTEYRHQLDRCSKSERRAIAAGTPREWLADNARNCRVVNEWISADARLNRAETKEYLLKTQELAEQQVLKAGYRLARILNELFG